VRYLFLSFLITSFMVAAISYTVIIQFLRKYLLVENFRGRKIPSAGGIVLLITYFIVISYFVLFQEKNLVRYSEWLLPLTILIFCIGVLGFIDDVFGKKGIGGFRGHFSQLLKGHVTTGVIKAIGGGIVCFIVASFFSKGIHELFINGLLMALMTNIFNLIDLRPGRALKLFLILGIAIFAFSFKSGFWGLSGIFFGIYVILLWADLTESCMLGDVGSNILGAVIGFSIVVNFSWLVNLILLILVGLIQIYTEGHSITELIESKPFLRSFDELGRRKERKKEVEC